MEGTAAQVFGPHLMIDLKKVSYEVQSNLKLHYDFLNNLPGLIDMTKIEMPKVFPYDGLVPADKGITGTVIIAESHITVHSFELKGWTFIDVFSCKPFHVERCLQYVLEVFKPGEYVHFVRERGLGFPRGNTCPSQLELFQQ